MIPPLSSRIRGVQFSCRSAHDIHTYINEAIQHTRGHFSVKCMHKCATLAVGLSFRVRDEARGTESPPHLCSLQYTSGSAFDILRRLLIRLGRAPDLLAQACCISPFVRAFDIRNSRFYGKNFAL